MKPQEHKKALIMKPLPSTIVGMILIDFLFVVETVFVLLSLAPPRMLSLPRRCSPAFPVAVWEIFIVHNGLFTLECATFLPQQSLQWAHLIDGWLYSNFNNLASSMYCPHHILSLFLEWVLKSALEKLWKLDFVGWRSVV